MTRFECLGASKRMVVIRKAHDEDIKALSRKLLLLLKDESSQIYIDNVVKFGIPDVYVEKAFAEETLQNAIEKGGATFYLAFENNDIIGFAQIIRQNASTAELDRIVVFPPYERKGIGTQLLQFALFDMEQKGVSHVFVNTGKEETHARRFYEKNGFKLVKEATIDTPWGKKLNIVTYQLRLGSI
ncbi:MAG: GNAT family N-acetyltransferase [Candidatus Bathyarchaeales archaeon]